MKGNVRATVIRIKLREMTESVDLVQENLTNSADSSIHRLASLY